jgi:interleukin-1 receptor-associated kinase 1
MSMLNFRLRCKNGTPALSWKTRGNIALGTSRGLYHLHANNIIHGDIKSGNILLDKHFEPKIGDFGLARSGPCINYSHNIVSTVVVRKT